MSTLLEELARLDQKILRMIKRGEATGIPEIQADIPELVQLRDDLQVVSALILWRRAPRIERDIRSLVGV